MMLLALECSTARNSLAILEDDRVLAEVDWHEPTARSHTLFQHLPTIVERAGLRPEDIELFVVGRGPGSYSGLRVALTTAQALALPGGRPVRTVASAASLAAQVAAAPHASAPWMAVLGDARRGQLWMGLFQRLENGVLKRSNPWKTFFPEDLPHALPPDALLVSSDYQRLRPVLEKAGLRDARWREGDLFPEAAWCGRLARREMARGVAPEPLTPLYLHPPVAGA